MAAENDTPVTDMRTHARTYDGVISLLKWGAVGSFMVGALVVWLIS